MKKTKILRTSEKEKIDDKYCTHYAVVVRGPIYFEIFDIAFIEEQDEKPKIKLFGIKFVFESANLRSQELNEFKIIPLFGDYGLEGIKLIIGYSNGKDYVVPISRNNSNCNFENEFFYFG